MNLLVLILNKAKLIMACTHTETNHVTSSSWWSKSISIFLGYFVKIIYWYLTET